MPPDTDNEGSVRITSRQILEYGRGRRQQAEDAPGKDQVRELRRIIEVEAAPPLHWRGVCQLSVALPTVEAYRIPFDIPLPGVFAFLVAPLREIFRF
jgi:hypothetical protein